MKATGNFCSFAERYVVRDTVKGKLNSLFDWIDTWVLYHFAKFEKTHLSLFTMFCTCKKQICEMKGEGKYCIFADVEVCKRYCEKQNLHEISLSETYLGKWDFVASTWFELRFLKKGLKR